MHPPLFFEDFAVGQLYESQSKTFTESEIIDFAWQYDPQPFHISTEGAKDTPFGGVIASGFQTLAVTFRLLWQANGLQATGIGAGGLDYVRWHKPVRPGDTLRATWEVMSTRPSGSKPGIGYVGLKARAFNQRDEEVMTLEATNIVRRKPEA